MIVVPGVQWRQGGFDAIDFSDLTASVRSGPVSWAEGGALVVPFDPEPSGSEQIVIRRRLLTRDAEHEARVAAMQAALAGLPDTLPDAVELILRDQLGPLA